MATHPDIRTRPKESPSIVTVPLIGGGIGYMLPVIAYFAFMLSQASSGRRLRELASELQMKERLKAKRSNAVHDSH